MTGMAVLAPGGPGTKGFWDLLTSGRTATRGITLFDATGFRSRIAAECDVDPVALGLTPAETARLDRAAQFALVCVRDCVPGSMLDLDRTDPYRVGVSVGSAVGCTASLEREYPIVSHGGRDWHVDAGRQSPHQFDYFVPSSHAAEVAREVDAHGPVALVSSGCTSGIDAVGHAARLIREGTVDVMVAGATDAPVSPLAAACFDAIRATSPHNDDPAGASRPFDRTRDGFVLAEGAAMFVLEAEEHARRRGAHVIAEIAGYAARCNAYHMTGLRPDGTEMAAAIGAALDQAAADPSDVDYVNAHGSGTRQNDRHETAAFKRALGEHAYRVPISSIKSMVGHSLGAIGSIEIAACALAIEHDVVPPTANLHEPDPECDLDYVPLVAREWPVTTALTVGSGFGGFQSALVLRAAA
jgi:act minimal PKS ketosynthase (KS/KS alpha)